MKRPRMTVDPQLTKYTLLMLYHPATVRDVPAGHVQSVSSSNIAISLTSKISCISVPKGASDASA